MPEVNYRVLIDPDDPMLEPLEIGIGKDLLISSSSGHPILIFDDRQGAMDWFRLDHHGSTDQAVRFRSWKVPDPAPPIPPMSNWQPPARQVEDAVLLLAALVRMMGGSVTISPSDLQEAQGGSLTNYVIRDPHSIALVYEEPK